MTSPLFEKWSINLCKIDSGRLFEQKLSVIFRFMLSNVASCGLPYRFYKVVLHGVVQLIKGNVKSALQISFSQTILNADLPQHFRKSLCLFLNGC